MAKKILGTPQFYTFWAAFFLLVIEQHNNVIKLKQTSAPPKKGVKDRCRGSSFAYTHLRSFPLRITVISFVLLVPYSQPNGLEAQEGKINSFVLVI